MLLGGCLVGQDSDGWWQCVVERLLLGGQGCVGCTVDSVKPGIPQPTLPFSTAPSLPLLLFLLCLCAYVCKQVQHTWGLHHPVVTRLPLSTTFNTGVGLAWFVKGVPTSANTASRHAPALTSVGGETAQQTATDATSSGGCSSSSWYNLLHTDTLPCARDPISQQVDLLRASDKCTSSTSML